MKNLVLGYPRGFNKWQVMADALTRCNQSVDIVTSNFDEIKGPYDKIWTMAESLFPLQAKLEKKWNVKNISSRTAEILSDKKQMDDFCASLGIAPLIPKSVIPTKIQDFDIFSGKSFIIKPTIGSGTKQDYKHKIDYISYNNIDSFIDDAYSDLLFKVNETGFVDNNFGGRINFYMAQEYLPHKKLYAPYVYVNQCGSIRNIFWVEGNIETNVIDKNRFESKPIDFMSINSTDVPKDVVASSEFYFQTIVDELNIKSMFFAGPDFYYETGLHTRVIDCNPRIGQGLQILNELNGNNILTALLENRQFDIDNHILWKNADLKPGTIKEIKDYSYLKKYITSTSLNTLLPGDVVKEFNNTPAVAAPKLSLKIPGKTRTDMYETYRSVSDELQACIVYED